MNSAVPSQPSRWSFYVGQIAVGVVMLTIVFVAMSWASTEILPVALLTLLVIGTGLNPLYVVFVAIVVGFGVRRRKPGLACSPVAFCLLWLAAAISQRAYFAAIIHAPTDKSPTSVRMANASLRWDGQLSREKVKLLAEHSVKAIVSASQPGTDPASWTVTVLSTGPECAGNRTFETSLLRNVGRFNECLVTDTVRTEPDGFTLRILPNVAGREVGELILKNGGVDEVVARWTSIPVSALSYLPTLPYRIIDLPPGSGGLWSNGPGGPLQRVYIGHTPFDATEMLEGVTGLHLSEPISSAPVSSRELVLRAREAAKGDRLDRSTAMKLVEVARQRGYVDDDSIRVAAASFGGPMNLNPEFYTFWRSIDEAPRKRLLDESISRLGDPAYAAAYHYCDRMVFIPPGLATRPPEVVAILRSQRGLALWQYRCAMVLVAKDAISTGFDDDNYKRVRHETLVDIADDRTSSFFLKALAFCEQFPRRTSEEQGVIGKRMADRPAGAEGDEFVRVCGRVG